MNGTVTTNAAVGRQKAESEMADLASIRGRQIAAVSRLKSMLNIEIPPQDKAYDNYDQWCEMLLLEAVADAVEKRLATPAKKPTRSGTN